MYSKTQVCAKIGNKLTESFRSDVGVRQGDNLSPTLFKIYINDLVDYINNTPSTDAVRLGTHRIQDSHGICGEESNNAVHQMHEAPA